jgi:uncharacterized protein YjbI with pentapeptide repeats
VLSDAQEGRDWTKRIWPVLEADSARVAPRRRYAHPPDLRRFKLDDERLDGASFAHANLSGATAFRTCATRLDCREAVLTGSRWRRAQIGDSNFARSNAHHAYFGRATFNGVCFAGADLRYARFRNAELVGVDFTDADLRFSSFVGARCRESTFVGSKVYGMSIWDLSTTDVDAQRIDLSEHADGSVTTNDLRLAPLVHVLTSVRELAEVISILKLNTVVVLGRDATPDAKALLERIASVAASQGFRPILVKDQAEIQGEPFLKKALMYCLLAKFVVVENSRAAGQIVELSRALDQGCILAVLQEREQGSTWLSAEQVHFSPNAKLFEYESAEIDAVAADAIQWANNRHAEVADELSSLYAPLELTFVRPPSGEGEEILGDGHDLL